MNQPFFSIIVPTYNRATLIFKTFDSVVHQNFKSFEVIVVDDGSTDDTATLLKSWTELPLQVVSVENGERGRARNIGVSKACGEYVYFLDSDDILYPDHLEKAFHFIRAHDNPEWIFQEYEFLTEQGKKRPVLFNKQEPIKDLVCTGNFMSCHGVFLRMDVASKFPFHEERTLAGSEDYALWLRLAARYRLLINPVVTSALVQHGQRSVFNFSPDALIARKMKMLEVVLSDEKVLKSFKSWIPQLRANSYSYISLHAALKRDRTVAMRYLMKGISAHPQLLLNRRTLAIVKHMLFLKPH